MNRLFFQSNLEGVDLKVAFPLCMIALAAFVLALLGLVPEAILQFRIGDVSLFRLLILCILGIGATILLPLVGLLTPNAIGNLPKVILILLSSVIFGLQVLNYQNQGAVIASAVAVWFLVGSDRFFLNPHFVVNVIVSVLRILQTIAVLVSTWVLLGSML